MKKKVFLAVGAVCLLGLYSCSNDNSVAEEELQSEDLYAKPKKEKGGNETSNIYDPFRLVSSSAHGRLDTIQTGFSFTEGPAVDKHGDVFFTDQPNDKIYKWSAKSGRVSLFLQGTGRSNGMAFDKQGNLIACADLHGELWKIYPNGSHKVLVDNYNGKKLNGPNDVWINPKTGGIYITDPIFPRDYWVPGDPRIQPWEPTHSEQAATGKGGHVYYLAPGSSKLTRVTTMPEWNADSWPNGIVGSPDGKKLYVNQWSYNGSGGIWSFDINHNGTLRNMNTFVPGLDFLDGMSMDEKGNVYVSGGPGVRAYDKNGNKVLEIPVAGPTNNVFAGENNKELFITSQNFVTSIKMNVKGVEKSSN